MLGLVGIAGFAIRNLKLKLLGFAKVVVPD